MSWFCIVEDEVVELVQSVEGLLSTGLPRLAKYSMQSLWYVNVVVFNKVFTSRTKFRIRETLNLLTDADISNNTKSVTRFYQYSWFYYYEDSDK